MEANLIFANGISASCSPQIKHMQRRISYPVLHALLTTTTTTPPPENISGVNLGNTTTTGGHHVTNDNWFDRLAIKHLSKSVQATTGFKNSKVGYESLVEAARAVQQNFKTKQQRELVIQALERAFPKPILSLIRILMPNSKFSREYFALFTTFFFPWLIGPCEVRESELNGRKEKNVVYMAKCRFLQESNCVGMCTNLCKMPSQTFIKNSFGIPVNMVPNFDDMSCQMVFGQEPPDENEDEAFKQPCYKLCKAKKRHCTESTSLQ